MLKGSMPALVTPFKDGATAENKEFKEIKELSAEYENDSIIENVKSLTKQPAKEKKDDFSSNITI